MKLGVYAGTRLLNHVLDLLSKQNISEVYLHVQKTNKEDTINFYKKFQFGITETIQNHYTNITTPDCYILTRYTVLSTTKKQPVILRGSDQRLLHCFIGFAMDLYPTLELAHKMKHMEISC